MGSYRISFELDDPVPPTGFTWPRLLYLLDQWYKVEDDKKAEILQELNEWEAALASSNLSLEINHCFFEAIRLVKMGKQWPLVRLKLIKIRQHLVFQAERTILLLIERKVAGNSPFYGELVHYL